MSTGEELKQQGNAAFKAKNFEEALSFYEQAITLEPDNIDHHNNAAAANHSLGRFNEAITCARNSLRIRENYKAHMRMGAALWGLNRLPEALMEYEKVATLAPEVTSVQQEIRKLRMLTMQQRPQPQVTPVVLRGKLGICLDAIVAILAVQTLLCSFFVPAFSHHTWSLLLISKLVQQVLIANTLGLVKGSKEVLLKWADYRCTLEALLCFFALISGVGPIMLLVGALGIPSVVNLALNQATIAEISPALHHFISPYLQKVIENQMAIVMYAVSLEAILLFTIMFTGGAIFTLVYIQYMKNIYRIDSNVKLAFTGIRMNISRLARSPYMPAIVDTGIQKLCDMLYLMAEQGM